METQANFNMKRILLYHSYHWNKQWFLRSKTQHFANYFFFLRKNAPLSLLCSVVLLCSWCFEKGSPLRFHQEKNCFKVNWYESSKEKKPFAASCSSPTAHSVQGAFSHSRRGSDRAFLSFDNHWRKIFPRTVSSAHGISCDLPENREVYIGCVLGAEQSRTVHSKGSMIKKTFHWACAGVGGHK